MRPSSIKSTLRALSLLLCVIAASCKASFKVEGPGKAISSNNADAGAAGQGVPVTAEDARQGSESAYVTLVTFSDLLSKSCAELATVVDQLREKYPQDLLRVVVKNQPSPNHTYAKLAATVGQGVFATKGGNAFFRYRDEIAHSKDVNADTIRKAAIQAGLTAQELDTGLEAGAWTEKVERDMALGKSLGVSDAPVTFANGVPLIGVLSIDALKDAVEVELAKAKVLERSGVARSAIYQEAVAANFADPKTHPKGANELEDPRTLWKVPVGSSPIRGKPTALVTIIEFSEFDCAYCKQVTETLAHVRTDYGDKVRIVWKDQPQASHPRSLAAASFARAARAQKGDAGFWEAHDLLYSAARLEDPDLELIARNAGLDVKAVMSATHSDAYRKEMDADADLAEDVEARGTPHFFVNGRRLIGAQPYPKFKVILDEEVKKAESLLRGGIAGNILYDWIVKDGRTGEPVRKIVPPNPNAPFRGSANAPVLVQEFGDFESAECRQVESTVDELLKRYPGQVRVAWRDLPRSEATLPAEAAREALSQKGNDAFFKMYGKLLGGPATFKREDLDGFAKDVGLDATKMSRALDTRSRRPDIDADTKVASEAAITSVPTFVVGNYVLMGPPTLPKLKRLVERALTEKPAAPATVSSKPGTRDPSATSAPSNVKFSIVDLAVGTGRQVKSGNTVTVHYRGRLLNGGTEFDSSYRRGPFTVAIGSGMVIKGWDLGLVGMRVGGRRRLTVPPELAYGNHGSGSSIPPNAALVFDIELLDVQ